MEGKNKTKLTTKEKVELNLLCSYYGSLIRDESEELIYSGLKKLLSEK